MCYTSCKVLWKHFHPASAIAAIPTNNPFLYYSQFSLLFITSQLVFSSHYSYKPHQHSLYTSAIFFLPVCTYSHPYNSTKNAFPISTIQPVQRPTEQVSLVWTDCVNLSLITTLTILISYRSYSVNFCIAGSRL